MKNENKYPRYSVVSENGRFNIYNKGGKLIDHEYSKIKAEDLAAEYLANALSRGFI